VKGNIASGSFLGDGILATGIVTGNYATNNRFNGIIVNQGSTVTGNTATNNINGFGISVDCPANVTDNTAFNNGFGAPGHPNIQLFGEGCNNTNNVAP
jgi:hypothetical protein